VTGVRSTRVRSHDVPSPAVTPPPGNPRFPLFDSLRAIAVVAVLVFHVTSLTGDLGRPVIGNLFGVLSNQGLTLFFVISGFLLYRPFVAARASGKPFPNLARYARRRVLRIVPAYWFALTVLAIFPGLVGVFSGDWWRYYFFLQLYSPATFGKGIPVAWTLCVEVTFYLALPVWAAAVRRIRPSASAPAWVRAELAALGGLALLGIVIQVLASRRLISDLMADSLLGQCVWFALGMSLAVASVAQYRHELAPWPVTLARRYAGLCWIGAAVCLAGVAAVLHPGGPLNILLTLRTAQPFGRTLAAIALTTVLIALLVVPAVFADDARAVPQRLLRAAPIAWVGLISYGIYLWHLTVAEFLALPADPGHFSARGLGLATTVHSLTAPILFMLTLSVSVAIAALSYRFVELPFLRRKER
jgi:peptidoglycan/LPS O-acetylase OafA/YrhL